MGSAHGDEADRDVPGARVPPHEAVLAVRERLHLRQVRVLLERQRQLDHDRQLQQLLPRVRPQQQEGRHARGVAGHHQAEDGAEAAEGVHGGQAEKGRNQRRLFGL